MVASVQLQTPLTELTGVKYPIVQTAMGWVSDVRLVAATANAGGLGFIASAMMTIEELEKAIQQVKAATDKPFGVNLRADATDAVERAELLIKYQVKVAGFALAPKQELIQRLKDHGIIVMPSVGAARHAEKVASWGADMVMIQGSEGGGHTGSVPTSLLLPSVLDAVDIPVIAAGGYFDGRGLASALAFGAAGVGMGTRFLLTRDNDVLQKVKEFYLQHGLNGTTVTKKIDGMPLRLLETEYIASLEDGDTGTSVRGLAQNILELRKDTGTSWINLLRQGVSMRKMQGRNLTQLAQAANTPIMMKAGLLEGDTERGILASGQVVGQINDIPSCQELIERVVIEAQGRLDALTALAEAEPKP